MGPTAGALFYLWMTQKTQENRVFTSAALERLRAPAVTMGLKERNLLFFAASILVITALAQPVVLEKESSTSSRANLLLAIDISIQTDEHFEDSKKKAAALISASEGENIGVIAYDEMTYLVVPLTQDTQSAAGLVQGLDREVLRREKSDTNTMTESVLRMKKGDDPLILIPVNPKAVIPVRYRNGVTILPLREGEAAAAIIKQIRKEKENNRLIPHIPLFHYPLGLAMLLVWIALSSMSKRRSVSLAAVAVALALGTVPPTHAGILDFRILHAAEESYEREEYGKSVRLFERYQQMHDSPQIRYNRANALYKAGRYDEAREWYERVYTTDPILRERTRYNLKRTVEMITRKKLPDKSKIVDMHPLEGVPKKETETKEVKNGGGKSKTRLYVIP